MRALLFIYSLILSSIIFSCADRRDSCITRGYYSEFNFQEIKANANTKQEAIFELVDNGNQIIQYKWLASDTIEQGPIVSFEDNRITLSEYIDSLQEIGFVFEFNLDQNNITYDAEEPAILESSTYWYFVEFEDENKVAKDFVEAILPIDSKTEAYIAAVSSLTDYDLFWIYEKDEIEPTIRTTGLDSYRLNLPYNISYCDPQQLGLLNIVMDKDGSFQIVENLEDYRTIDCSCD